jgi:nitrite reductase/ring-hydroxylating ferredoxin subunit
MSPGPALRGGPREHVVCRVEDLVPGGVRIVRVGKFGVGVYNIDGAFHALTNFCPHQGAPLCRGKVQGTNVRDPDGPGGMRRVLEGRVVRCPWHRWEFDITDGRMVADRRKGIRVYEVVVRDGEVVLKT